MNENRSFAVTLALAVMSGTLIGLVAFSFAGKDASPAPVTIASPDGGANTTAAPSAPSPSPSPSTAVPESMAPVHYDDPNAAATPPPPANGDKDRYPPLM